MKSINNYCLNVFCLLRTARLVTLLMVLIITPFAAVAHHDLTIGVIVGKNKNRTSTSNQEKMCILKNVADNFVRKQHSLKFVFVQNDRTAIGSANAAKELLESDVDLALLPLVSKEAEIAADILSEKGIPFVTTATSTSVIKPGASGLSIMPSNLHQANLLAALYLSEYQGKTLHVVTNQSNGYSKSISQSFIKEVVSSSPNQEIIQHNYTSVLAPSIAKAIGEGDVVFAPLYNPNIAILYTFLAEEDRHISIIGPDSIGARKEFFDIIGNTSEKLELKLLRNWDYVLKGDRSDELVSYVKTYCYEKKSTFLTTYSFDLINFVLSRVKEIPNDATGKEVIETLKTSDYVTAMDGTSMSFDSDGYMKKSMYLYEVKDNSVHLVTSIKARK